VKSAANSRELFLLGLLYRKPMHGYELVKNLEVCNAEVWLELSDKHVYNVLRKFEREGLAVSEAQRVDGRPNRKVYRLTPHGRSKLRDMLRSEAHIENGSDCAFIGALSILSYADPLPAEERAAILRRRRDSLQRQLDEAAGLADHEAVDWWLGGTMRSLWEQHHCELRSQVEWLDALAAEIATRGWDAMRMPHREPPPGWDAPAEVDLSGAAIEEAAKRLEEESS
jgi:DNA-binding PadR family transcriptional regulator